MIKNQKGITLIALVITIIVLLILAGVSIAMLTGPNGLLTQAQNSQKYSDEAALADRINLSIEACYARILSGNKPLAADYADTPSGDDFTVTESGTKITGAEIDYSITITAKNHTDVTGKIEYKDGGWVVTKAVVDTTK